MKNSPLIPVHFILPSSGGTHIGGMEMIAADILQRLNPSKYRPSLICFNRDNAVISRIDTHRVHVHIVEKQKNGIDLTLIPKLAWYFRKTGARIVHTFNEGALLYGMPAAKLGRVPALIHAEHGRLPRYERPILTKTRIQMAKAADHIVVVSEALRKLLTEEEGIPNEKVSVVINGVDTSRFDFQTDRNTLRNALKLQPDDWVVGTVGSLTVAKNQALLIKAAAKVPNIKVLIAGAGPLQGDLRTLIQELNVADRVRLVGQLNDIPGFLGALDLFALSSITEATSIALLEAMAARLPVIATDVGGNRAVIQDAGYLVPSEDIDALATQLQWCKDHREECKKKGQMGRDRMEQHYSMEATVKAYEDIFEAALRQASRRPWFFPTA